MDLIFKDQMIGNFSSDDANADTSTVHDCSNSFKRFCFNVSPFVITIL